MAIMPRSTAGSKEVARSEAESCSEEKMGFKIVRIDFTVVAFPPTRVEVRTTS